MGAYLEELSALRHRTPIGVRRGLALLYQTNGDVGAAEALFQQELTQVVAHQAQVSAAAARHALELAGYDVPRTLQQLEQARYSLTQRSASCGGTAIPLTPCAGWPTPWSRPTGCLAHSGSTWRLPSGYRRCWPVY
jgi:hypothetical protein